MHMQLFWIKKANEIFHDQEMGIDQNVSKRVSLPTIWPQYAINHWKKSCYDKTNCNNYIFVEMI